MLKIGSYTKSEVATAIGYQTDKASNLTNKLTKLGYRFSTQGRGSTYRINIIATPQLTLKEFSAKNLGISARFEDRLAHFLKLILTPGDDFNYLDLSYRSLEWHTNSSYMTIEDWMKSLIQCGLLVEKQLISVYYATQREILTENENGDYEYTQIVKYITKEEYDRCIEAYDYTIKSFGDISKNPDVASDEAIYLANSARREALDGWWGMKKKDCYALEVNKAFPHLPQLLLLLEEYKVEDYKRTRNGNHEKDYENWLKRWEEWEVEKYEKKKRLAKEYLKNCEYYSEVEKIEVSKEVIEMAKEIEAEEETYETYAVKAQEKWNTVEVETEEVFSNPRDFLCFINENYYKTGRWIYNGKK